MEANFFIIGENLHYHHCLNQNQSFTADILYRGKFMSLMICIVLHLEILISPNRNIENT